MDKQGNRTSTMRPESANKLQTKSSLKKSRTNLNSDIKEVSESYSSAFDRSDKHASPKRASPSPAKKALFRDPVEEAENEFKGNIGKMKQDLGK
jgi:hypothetical protein